MEKQKSEEKVKIENIKEKPQQTKTSTKEKVEEKVKIETSKEKPKQTKSEKIKKEPKIKANPLSKTHDSFLQAIKVGKDTKDKCLYNHNGKVVAIWMPKYQVYALLYKGPRGGIFIYNSNGKQSYYTSKLIDLQVSANTLFNQKVPIQVGPMGGLYANFPSKGYLKHIHIVDINDPKLVSRL